MQAVRRPSTASVQSRRFGRVPRVTADLPDLPDLPDRIDAIALDRSIRAAAGRTGQGCR
jgi:hypothetical protein